MRAFFVDAAKGMARLHIEGEKELFNVPLKALPRNVSTGSEFDLAPPKGGTNTAAKANAKAAAKAKADGTGDVPPKGGGKGASAHDRQQYAVRRLMSEGRGPEGKGWSKEQAAGIVGRFMQEAFPHLDTKARGDLDIPGASVGIGQWNRERKTALIRFAKKAGTDATNFDTQLDFFDWEIKNSPKERRALVALTAAQTPEEASEAMMHYERPSGYTPSNPRGGHAFSLTVRNAGRVLQGYDPTYTPTVDVAGGDLPNITDPASLVESIMADLGAGDAPAGGGLDGEEDGLSLDEPTLGETMGEQFASDMSAGQADTTGTDSISQDIEEMIAQGQAAASSASGFPTFAELFGERV